MISSNKSCLVGGKLSEHCPEVCHSSSRREYSLRGFCFPVPYFDGPLLLGLRSEVKTAASAGDRRYSRRLPRLLLCEKAKPFATSMPASGGSKLFMFLEFAMAARA